MSNRQASVYVGRLFIIIAALTLNSYGLSLPRQNVPKPFCPMAPDPLKPDTSHCFDLITQTITVCKEVTSLGDLYKFCTSIPIPTPIIAKPARIMLCLDASNSMCTDLANCPGSQMNDPTNKRIEAAHAFVDSVAERCLTCQIGVVYYTQSTSTNGAGTIPRRSQLAPLPLTTANIAQIHTIINSAGCGARGVVEKIQDVKGLAKTKLTYSGIALDTAIHMVDQNYDTTYDRHIIIMTDGDWQTPIPDDIYTEYITTTPGRPFPTVHGVFLSDSARHVAAGYPPQGLIDCSIGDTMQVDLSLLHAATQLSIRNPAPNNKAGLYFPGATPQTIVATFIDSLFKVIIIPHIVYLRTITFTNTTFNPPETKTAVIIFNGIADNQLLLTVRVPGFPLQFGINTFIAAATVVDTSNIVKTSYDTLTIIRASEDAGAIRPPGSAATLVKAQKLSLSRTFFDARGRLLSNYDMRAFTREAIPYKGVYFVKYDDGKVVRRVSVIK